MDTNNAWAIFDRAVIDGTATWWQMELPSGKVTFGDAKADMLGRDANDFMTYVDFTDLLHQDDHEQTMQAMRDHLEGKKDVYECIYRIKHADGSYIRFYDCGKVTKREGDSVTVTGFVHKIEEGVDENEQKDAFKHIVVRAKPSLVDTVAGLQ